MIDKSHLKPLLNNQGHKIQLISFKAEVKIPKYPADGFYLMLTTTTKYIHLIVAKRG